MRVIFSVILGSFVLSSCASSQTVPEPIAVTMPLSDVELKALPSSIKGKIVKAVAREWEMELSHLDEGVIYDCHNLYAEGGALLLGPNKSNVADFKNFIGNSLVKRVWSNAYWVKSKVDVENSTMSFDKGAITKVLAYTRANNTNVVSDAGVPQDDFLTAVENCNAETISAKAVARKKVLTHEFVRTLG